MLLKIQVFLGVTLCRLVNNYGRFEEGTLLELLGPENEGTTFLETSIPVN